MQLQRTEQCIHLPIRPTHVTQTAWPRQTIEHSRIRNEPHAAAREKHAAKELAIVVSQHPRIPRAGSFCQFTTDEPSRRLHVRTSFDLAEEPLNRCEIGPQRTRYKLGAVRPMQKATPRRREHLAAVRLTIESLELTCNLVRREEVISIKPLDVVAPAQRKRVVPSGRGALISLADGDDTAGGIPLRNRKVPSVDSSSTTIISFRDHVCRRADSIVSASQASALNAGIRIETRGFTSI